MPPAVILVNNRKLAEGFFLGVGAADPGSRAAGHRQARQDRPGPGGRAAAVRRRAVGRGRRRSAWRSRRSAGPTRPSSSEVRALGVEHELLDEGLEELAAVVGAAAERMPGRGRRRPQDRPRAGLLHRHGLRDPAGRVRGLRVDLLRRPLRRPGQRRPLDLPRRRHLARRVAPDGRPARARARPGEPLGAHVRAGGRHRRGRPRRSPWPIAGALRARGIPVEVAPKADKFGKQIRYADRRGIPFVWFPDAEGGSVKDIRSGDQEPADPALWTPPARGPAPAHRAHRT